MGSSLSKAIFSFKTNILNSKLERLHKKAIATLKEDNLVHLNFKKRQELITHALLHSTFYKNKYAGTQVSKEGLKTPEEFIELPPLTREELCDNFHDIKSDNVSKIQSKKVTTSGSTGIPVSVLHDRRLPETPIRWRILSWWGIEPWENQAFIYRFERPFLERLGNAIMWWPTKRIFLAAANPTQKQLNKFVSDFNKIKPTLLQGYVDVVFEFALYLLDNNIKIYPPKMVWVTSAPLFEEQRELIEKAFDAPVCDQYGNTEILLIGAECKEQNGLHIMQDTVHIEFVDENNKPVPPNTTGKILLTDLTNYAFPLIRYEIGDEGKYKEEMCTCGRPLPLMENVRGRQALIIKTPSGLVVRGEHIVAMFDGHMKYFKEIQLCQEANFSVSINYVPRKSKEAHKEAEKMVQLLRQRTRLEIVVKCKQIDKISQVGKKTPLIINYS